jgi:molybdate/tungstate transport system substrate-binding protein
MERPSGDRAENSELIIFHAGSLSAPFKEIARQFEAENPGVRVLLEAAGSVDCARKITELNRPCDLMASSDYKVIEKFLIPSHTSWHIPFASNEMVIAFRDRSRRSSEIDSVNWTDLLLDPEVRFARSDPASDPCGYRTLMAFQLAEQYYDKPGLSEELAAKDRRYIRPKEVDLIALLEAGEIDYFFIYRSVAMQHQLRYIELSLQINLKSPSLSDLYFQSSVEIPGNKPGDTVIIHGEPMVYSITMIDNSPNPENAKAFLHFLLDTQKGLKVMEKMGQEPVVPSRSAFYEDTPSGFRKYLLP